MISFNIKKEKEFDTPKLVVDVKPDLVIDIDEKSVIAEALNVARSEVIRVQVRKAVQAVLKREYYHCMHGYSRHSGTSEEHKGYQQASQDLVEYITKEMMHATNKE